MESTVRLGDTDDEQPLEGEELTSSSVDRHMEAPERDVIHSGEH